MSDIESIAQRMRDDELAVVDFLAEQIEVVHEPPSPIDGTVDRATLAGAMRMFASDDATARELLGVDIEGDEIVRRAVLRSPDDGPTIAHTGRFRVAHGRIVAVRSRYEPQASEGVQ